jgi:hypothetical protein
VGRVVVAKGSIPRAVHRHHGDLPGATDPAIGWERPSADDSSATGRRSVDSTVRKGRDGPMASIAKRIKDFARSPRGQQLIEQAKEQASKPENRRRLEELRKRYVKRR